MRLLSALLLLLFAAATAVAQPIPDDVTTSCEGVTERLSDTLAAGRPVIVAMLGFDCWTQCNPDAPMVGAFARDNAGRVHVWAAMFNLERPDKTPGTCDSMAAWKERHGWTNVHAFVDEPVTWAYAFGAHYIVVAPAGMLAYRGDHFPTAARIARELADDIADVADGEVLPTRLDLR